MEETKLFNMSENEFRSFMAELKDSNERQAKYAKKTYIMSIISAALVFVFVMIVGICAFKVVPRAIEALNRTEVTLERVDNIVSDIEQVDIAGLVNDVGSLVVTTEKDLTVATEQIASININELNRAIKNLSDIIQPLANFFNKF